jgi:hypothetical protein
MAQAPRRFRGMGHGRKLRRTLEKGGTGASGRLNTAIGNWSGVKITPMFGRWGYFMGEQLFACFPLREKEHDLWIRLNHVDQARALKEPGLRPHRRFASRGWIEMSVDSPEDVSQALRWLRRAYHHAQRWDAKGESTDG